MTSSRITCVDCGSRIDLAIGWDGPDQPVRGSAMRDALRLFRPSPGPRPCPHDEVVLTPVPDGWEDR